jgi:hypothetical protein
MSITRRSAFRAVGASALAVQAAQVAAQAEQVPPAPKESAGTPKIAVGMGDGGERGVAPKRIKQLGVEHVLSGGPQMLPWTVETLTAVIKPWQEAGVAVSNLMIGLSPDIIYGRAGDKRDQEGHEVPGPAAA